MQLIVFIAVLARFTLFFFALFDIGASKATIKISVDCPTRSRCKPGFDWRERQNKLNHSKFLRNAVASRSH